MTRILARREWDSVRAVPAVEIVEGLQAALEEVQTIQDDLAQTPGAKEGGHDA